MNTREKVAIWFIYFTKPVNEDEEKRAHLEIDRVDKGKW